MKKNVGGIDKIIRIIFGIVLVVLGAFMELSTGFRIGFFAVAGVAFVTAFTGL